MNPNKNKDKEPRACANLCAYLSVQYLLTY